MGKHKYELDAGTIAWARRRYEQLERSENKIGMAIDRINSALDLLNDAALGMEDQPESEEMRFYASTLETTRNAVKRGFDSLNNDRGSIGRAILRYEQK